ncbi:trna wybutosine-synthesizing protein 2/3/4 [Fagus crenata]
MDDAVHSILVPKAWLVVVLVFGILGNWKLAEGDNEHAGRKLDVDDNPAFRHACLEHERLLPQRAIAKAEAFRITLLCTLDTHSDYFRILPS